MQSGKPADMHADLFRVDEHAEKESHSSHISGTYSCKTTTAPSYLSKDVCLCCRLNNCESHSMSQKLA